MPVNTGVPMERKHTTLNMPPELIKQAKKKAIDEGTTVSAVVIAFLESWVSGKIQVPGQPKGGKQKK